jgi:ABC-type transporter Mla subunit MlaD
MTKKEIEALKTQLEQYLPELKAEIDGAKKDIKDARSLKTSITNIVNSSNDLLTKLNDPANGVDVLLVKGNDELLAITNKSEAAQKLLDNIQTLLDTANLSVSDMETAYANFTAVKEKIDEPENGLQTTLDVVKNLRTQAKSASTQASNLLATADKTLTKVQTYISSIDSAYDDFLNAKKKVDDPTDGLEAILLAMKKLRDNISAIADKSTTLFTKINEYKDEASKNLDDIIKHKDNSGTALKNIEDNQTASEAGKRSIETLLKIASQESSTAYFKKRTLFVTYVASAWLVLGIAALITAVVIGHELITAIEKNTVQLQVVIARAVVVTPTIAFAFYAFRNYGKERNIAEQYAFKEISGATIEGHIEMARRALPKAKKLDEKLTNTILGVIKGIHSEPSELQKTSKLSVKANSKFFDLGTEISDIGNNVVDIKDIITKSDVGTN